MAITEVSSNTFLADTVNLIRNKLRDNIDDPLAQEGGRPARQRFVHTSYPQRAAGFTYPIITVVDRGIGPTEKLGMGSDGAQVILNMEVRIWARNVRERDELFDKVYTYLRQDQYDDEGLLDANLSGFKLTSALNISEDGEHGIKSKVCEIQFLFICQ